MSHGSDEKVRIGRTTLAGATWEGSGRVLSGGGITVLVG